MLTVASYGSTILVVVTLVVKLFHLVNAIQILILKLYCLEDWVKEAEEQNSLWRQSLRMMEERLVRLERQVDPTLGGSPLLSSLRGGKGLE